MNDNVLILSDHPPAYSNVAGLSTAGFLPAIEGGTVCCVAINPLAALEVHPSISMDRLLLLKRRYETGWRYGPPGLNEFTGHLAFRAKLLPLTRSYRKQIVQWARVHKPEKLWAVTSSLTVILVAKRIAEALDIPIYTHILDIAEHECSRRTLDKWSTRLVMREFRALLQASRKIGVVSDGMAEHYASWGHNNFVVIRHGVSPGQGAGESSHQRNKDVFRIGFSGSLYALDAWESLLSALDELHWQIGNRPIIIRMFGKNPPRIGSRPVNIEWMGWRKEQEVVDLLRTCDICYLPYPFSPQWADVVRTSFATKYSSYVATGRPVLVHAPAASSITRFCIEHKSGLTVESLDTAAVKNAIRNLQDEFILKELESGARDALNGPLSEAHNLANFRMFMEIEDQ